LTPSGLSVNGNGRARARDPWFGWQPPEGPEELEAFQAWAVLQKRHHGRTSKPHFLEAWAFPKPVEDLIRQAVSNLNGTVPRPVIHVCSGSSRIGDVTVDLEQPADVKASCFALPFPDGYAGTVICDPPWNMPYHLRHRINRELYRVTQPGGGLIWNAPWLPHGEWNIAHVFVHAGSPWWPANINMVVFATKPSGPSERAEVGPDA